tara:strand:- start:31 stop:528 length:498 start_codon:yes stop_codon:yes gene_type:complete
MPNHCTTNLHLDGDFAHRQEFVDKNKGFSWGDAEKKGVYQELSFHAQVPVPKKHTNAFSNPSSDNGWYGWCIKNWGTKWDCYEINLDHDKPYTIYSFDTAWGSPHEWVKKVSRKFPHIKFNVEWAEEGGEGGKYMFHGGDCFYETRMSEEQWKEFMGYEEEDEDN